MATLPRRRASAALLALATLAACQPAAVATGAAPSDEPAIP